jgi:hypothetical protein
MVRRSDNPDQQFLIKPEPDLRPLRDWICPKVSKRICCWRTLCAADRVASVLSPCARGGRSARDGRTQCARSRLRLRCPSCCGKFECERRFECAGWLFFALLILAVTGGESEYVPLGGSRTGEPRGAPGGRAGVNHLPAALRAPAQWRCRGCSGAACYPPRDF